MSEDNEELQAQLSRLAELFETGLLTEKSTPENARLSTRLEHVRIASPQLPTPRRWPRAQQQPEPNQLARRSKTS